MGVLVHFFWENGCYTTAIPGRSSEGGSKRTVGNGTGKVENECDYIFVMRNEVPQIDGRINASLSDPIHKNGICFWSVD